MTADENGAQAMQGAQQVERLLDTKDLADALESDRFKQFLDQVPVAIAVSELRPSEHIVYTNVEFERLTGQPAAVIVGRQWTDLPGTATAADDRRDLGAAIASDQDYIGGFTFTRDGVDVGVDAWSNIIEDDAGVAIFRLVALVVTGRVAHDDTLAERLREKDTLLRELQHRVKNNLQMITALIRLEARNLPDEGVSARFDRLAGRVEALALLYRSLSEEGQAQVVDLGIYLSQIATAVMGAHAVEGIRLDMKVDAWPVSINVAMPAGLAVNELLTNSLKHAFTGRDGGTITLHSLVDELGCKVMVADDGNGLPHGTEWPKTGKLGALIVESLRENANAHIQVESQAGAGVRVTMFFSRADAVPKGVGRDASL